LKQGWLWPALAMLAVLAHGKVAAQPTPAALEYTVPRLVLRLQQGSGGCELMLHKPPAQPRNVATALPWPCAFHADAQGQPRRHVQGGATYLLIESSTPAQGRDCDTQLQAVRVRGDAVRLAPHRSRLASCPPFQWEAPVFTGAF
jgi:hypothetical protein